MYIGASWVVLIGAKAAGIAVSPLSSGMANGASKPRWVLYLQQVMQVKVLTEQGSQSALTQQKHAEECRLLMRGQRLGSSKTC